MIALIVVIVVITAGVVGWMFAKKSQAPAPQTELIKPTAPVAQKQPTASSEVQPQTTNMPADWKAYQDKELGYEFFYPSGWKLADPPADPKSYNITIFKDDGSSIQIVNVANGYGKNADGSVSNRESVLKKISVGDDKISIGGGTGYFYVNESKDGPNPTVYLVGNKQILLMSYNIFYPNKTPLSEDEKLFKQIISNFKFTN